MDFTVIDYDTLDLIFENHPTSDRLTLIEGFTEGFSLDEKIIYGSRTFANNLLHSFSLFVIALLIVHFS